MEKRKKNFKVFIPGNVPSLKNSKIKTTRGIFPSKAVKNYLRSFGIKRYSVRDKEVECYSRSENLFYPIFRKLPKLHEKDYPILIGFHFIRKTHADFDFNNATQIIQDLLVAHNIIADDSMRFVIPYPLKIDDKYYSIDKHNPGVILLISYGPTK